MNLPLVIEFSTAVHHGDGFGISGVVDRSLLRNSAGEFYLGGSAIKGRLRFGAQRYLGSDARPEGEKQCCEPGHPCRESDPCLLCWTFGSIRRRGSVVFSDAFLMDPERALVRELLQGQGLTVRAGSFVRATTAIDRRRRIVEAEHLFTTEVTPPSLRFSTALSIQDNANAQRIADMLRTSARLLTTFGSGSARGLGFCTWSISAEEPAR